MTRPLSIPLAIFCDDVAHLRQGEVKPREVKVETILWRSRAVDHEDDVPGYFYPDRYGRVAQIDEGFGGMPVPGNLESRNEQPTSEQTRDKSRRWRFHCRLCKRTVTIRDERLSRIGAALFVSDEAFDEASNSYRVSLAWLQRAAMLD